MDSSPDQRGESDIAQRPLFAEAQARLALKKGDIVFIARFDEHDERFKHIVEATITATGIRPKYSYADDTGHVSIWDLNPHDAWGLTQEEAERRETVRSKRTTEITPAAPAEDKSLVLSERPTEDASAPCLLRLKQRMDVQRALGLAILDPEKGGINLLDIPTAAKELAVRIGYPIVEFGIKSPKELVEEGFIAESLYHLLGADFDQLFNQIQKMLEAVIALKPSLPKETLGSMQSTVFQASTSLTEKFLQTHANQIELLQLLTLDPEATTRAFLSLLLENREMASAFVKALRVFDSDGRGNRAYSEESSTLARKLINNARDEVRFREKKL